MRILSTIVGGVILFLAVALISLKVSGQMTPLSFIGTIGCLIGGALFFIWGNRTDPSQRLLRVASIGGGPASQPPYIMSVVCLMFAAVLLNNSRLTQHELTKMDRLFPLYKHASVDTHTPRIGDTEMCMFKTHDPIPLVLNYYVGNSTNSGWNVVTKFQGTDTSLLELDNADFDLT